ncbi:phosphatidate cytidylyltransferase [Cognatishimia activa]|uniref:phosphatidate cytidylyltransferase n=1 Tax=Cognatishimia activa TaxID=1715691 RepID=UPI00222EEB9C|nr:phosphatidate cytidylyltransferase [Cognatishimia activa]UZD91936.1 phosphatidate cytidylyltransferase [Cognatishimia activa]
MSSGGKWADLQARVLSAVVMLAVGLFGLWQGGPIFHFLVAAVLAGMIWELTRMAPTKSASWPAQMGFLVFAAFMALLFVPPAFFMPLVLAPALVGISGLTTDSLRYALYSGGLLLACFGLIVLREFHGVEWVLWLIFLVVATDVAGYFAGKLIGGPKFWPSLSPKKTWAGTSAGWVAAFFVGLIFGGVMLGVISMIISFASQLGDISESAIKRRAGVKDSSNLIPGHGGLLDRFDGLMAAALVVLMISATIGLPH